MRDTTCNGWTNYQTWVVNLWLDNDGMSSEIEDWASEEMQAAIDADKTDIRADAMYALAQRIESWVDELQDLSEHKPSGMFADLLGHALGMVDWHEIAKHYTDEIPLYAAGWNMPGYTADSVAYFLDLNDAREYLAEQIKRDAESEDLSDKQAQALMDDAQTVRDGKGEVSVTLGKWHYFANAA